MLLDATGAAGATGPTGTFDPNANIVGVGPNVSSQFSELRVSQKTPLIELTSVIWFIQFKRHCYRNWRWFSRK